ncbi:MAG: hypothetical protein F7B17_06710 [Desulfurococcales archaeon]|nr:hypothetical protein [Desulfurococcales archaeon]
MSEIPVAAIDVGTSNVKLAVYDESLSIKDLTVVKAPLKVSSLSIRHDPDRLRIVLGSMLVKASRLGAKFVGVSVYRGSVASWRRGGLVRGDIVLWADYLAHHKAYTMLPLRAKVLEKLPIIGNLLGPTSPLPLLLYKSQAAGAERAWTIDALVAEWLVGRYAGEPVNAGLLGVLDPIMGFMVGFHRLSGFKGEEPAIVLHDEVLGEKDGVHIGPVIADQQSSFLASRCLIDDCVKVDMGSGFFATASFPGPGALLMSGVVPLIALKTRDSHLACIESMAPGVGIFLEEASRLLGGFSALKNLNLEICLRFRPPPSIPYVPAPRENPYLPSNIPSAAIGRGREVVACSIVAGASLALAYHIYRAGRTSDSTLVRAFGGASRLNIILEIASALTGYTIEAYPNVEAASRGAAILALHASGYMSLREALRIRLPEPLAVFKGGKPSLRLLQAWEDLVRGRFSVLSELLEEYWEIVGSIM